VINSSPDDPNFRQNHLIARSHFCDRFSGIVWATLRLSVEHITVLGNLLAPAGAKGRSDDVTAPDEALSCQRQSEWTAHKNAIDCARDSRVSKDPVDRAR
jgi:hypothetical protein